MASIASNLCSAPWRTGAHSLTKSPVNGGITFTPDVGQRSLNRIKPNQTNRNHLQDRPFFSKSFASIELIFALHHGGAYNRSHHCINRINATNLCPMAPTSNLRSNSPWQSLRSLSLEISTTKYRTMADAQIKASEPSEPSSHCIGNSHHRTTATGRSSTEPSRHPLES
jgi:hypothetical protein